MNGFVSALALCGKAFKNIGSICSTMRLEAICQAVRIKHLHHSNTPSTTQVQLMTMLWTYKNQQILSVLKEQDTGPTRKYFLRTWMTPKTLPKQLRENGSCRRLLQYPTPIKPTFSFATPQPGSLQHHISEIIVQRYN
jgi:hypothetical protein